MIIPIFTLFNIMFLLIIITSSYSYSSISFNGANAVFHAGMNPAIIDTGSNGMNS